MILSYLSSIDIVKKVRRITLKLIFCNSTIFVFNSDHKKGREAPFKSASANINHRCMQGITLRFYRTVGWIKTIRSETRSGQH